ncbi:GAF domain-containing protein [Pontibacter sp. E15-1]|uniref:GAF domain-containing protein n=1 Tax=Pontibacter sp. E15-1 TaxID=2919918 RepID=UPI001F4FABA5|nr:GAF domain-containing protein [Pontibacter sp. E15-1]MCJ8166481.1 GAF domain-containing protein [Pontibacter sp. E15-1]
MAVDYKEEERIKVLRRYEILDTPEDGSWDRLTRLAAKFFNMPIAVVSLVDTDRIWFKSHYGLAVREIGTDPGLCTTAIMSDDIYIVENALEDPRTLTNPLVVSEFGLRFYAAVPLKTSDGYNIGTFAIIDSKPRYLTETQQETLKELAGIAMDEIELRLSARRSAREMNQLLEATRSHLQDTTMEIAQIPITERSEKFMDIADASRELIGHIEEQLRERK